MDHLSPASRLRVRAQCARALNTVLLCMKKNQIPIPTKYHKSRIVDNLPKLPTESESTSADDIRKKLNVLLVYAESAKQLKSELLADIVLEKVRRFETQFLNPPEDKGIPQPLPPPPPSLSPEEEMRRKARRRNANNRLRKIHYEITRSYENKGIPRSARVTINQAYTIGNGKPVTLPPQTIPIPGQPQDPKAASRADVNRLSRQHGEKFGEIRANKKILHSTPDYERYQSGARLPTHGLTSSTNDQTQSGYKYLEERRKLDRLPQDLGKTVTCRRRLNYSDDDEGR